MERRAYESSDALRVAEGLLRMCGSALQKYPLPVTPSRESAYIRGSGRCSGIGGYGTQRRRNNSEPVFPYVPGGDGSQLRGYHQRSEVRSSACGVCEI